MTGDSKRPDNPASVLVPFDLEENEESTKLISIPPDIGVPKVHMERSTAYLIVLKGSNVGEMYRIADDSHVLGRSFEATIRLHDSGISRRHAQLIRRGGQIFIEDLGSANGTLVNETPIREAALKDGDKIRLGSTTILKFTFHDKLDETFQKQMFDAALRDGLTKAFNKRYLLDRLENEFAFARRHRSDLSIIMFDVDHFKRFNDTYGHLAGDAVLVHLVRTVHASLRTEDVFARYGGEEFMLICRGSGLENATIVAERLRVLIAGSPLEFQGTSLAVTSSLGVASLRESQAQTSLELIAAVDHALYEAKGAGRNCVRAHRGTAASDGGP